MNTVAENRERFVDREVKGARGSRQALGMLGFPSERDFEDMMRSNIIVNCPITHRNIVNAENIFGPDVNSLKGELLRRKPVSVVSD